MMEDGGSLTNYIGYGFICLFLVVIVFTVGRSALFFAALATLPFTRKGAENETSDDSVKESSDR